MGSVCSILFYNADLRSHSAEVCFCNHMEVWSNNHTQEKYLKRVYICAGILSLILHLMESNQSQLFNMTLYINYLKYSPGRSLGYHSLSSSRCVLRIQPQLTNRVSTSTWTNADTLEIRIQLIHECMNQIKVVPRTANTVILAFNLH